MKDEAFIRGAIPMTKSEVRAVSVSRLELKPEDILYDVGAGTGSVSVEAALLIPRGRVYAFEQKEEGCSLIQANAQRHGVKNITVVQGKAPDTWEGLPAPDCIFIGGSGGSGTGLCPESFCPCGSQCYCFRKSPSDHGILQGERSRAGGILYSGVKSLCQRTVSYDGRSESRVCDFFWRFAEGSEKRGRGKRG